MEETLAKTNRPNTLLSPSVLDNIALLFPLLSIAVAWVLLIDAANHRDGLALCLSPEGDSAGRFISAFKSEIYLADWAKLGAEWGLMIVAMMLPITMPHLIKLRARTFRAYQTQTHFSAVAGYFLVWTGIWLPFCLALFAIRSGLSVLGLSDYAPLFAYVAAMGWLLFPARQQAIIRCHRLPFLSGASTKMSATAAIYGIRLGRDCSIVCLPIMAAPMIAGQSTIAMFSVTYFLVAERIRPSSQVGTSAGLILFAVLMTLGWASVSS